MILGFQDPRILISNDSKILISQSSQAKVISKIIPSETDVTPRAINGLDWVGLEISGRGYARSTFSANFV